MKSFSDSESDFAALFALSMVRVGPVVCSSDSPDLNMAELQYLSRRCFKIYESKGTELVSASDTTPHPGHVLDGTVQSAIADFFFTFHGKKDAKHSAYDEFSFPDMEETVQLVTEVLYPGALAAVFSTA